MVLVPSTYSQVSEKKDPSIQSLISNLVSHFQLWTKCKYAIQSNHVEGKSTPQYKTPYFNGTTSGPNMSKPPFFEYLKFRGCILAQLISCDLGLPQFFSDFLSGIKLRTVLHVLTKTLLLTVRNHREYGDTPHKNPRNNSFWTAHEIIKKLLKMTRPSYCQMLNVWYSYQAIWPKFRVDVGK